jgi:cytochrome b6-f complex iron-sulfur subunit
MQHNKKTQSPVNRRDFLKVVWGISLVGLFGQAGIALTRFLKPRAEAGTFGSKVTAGQAGEFEIGTVNHIQKGRFYLVRLEDSGFIALWQRCTHLGCTVPWREDEGQFHCPCHSSIFDRTGEVISGPAPRPMDLFPMEIQDDEVVVDTGNPIERDHYDSSQATYV